MCEPEIVEPRLVKRWWTSCMSRVEERRQASRDPYPADYG